MTTVQHTPERESRITAFMTQEREAIEKAYGSGVAEANWPRIQAWIDSLPWMGDVDLAHATVVNSQLSTLGPMSAEGAARLVAARRTLASLTREETIQSVASRMGVRYDEAEAWAERAEKVDETDWANEADRCALYRHFDAQGVLLYVGITARPERRAEQHRARSRWWRFVGRSEVEWFDSSKEAAQAERDAIHAEEPVFNGTHNRNRRIEADYLLRALDRAEAS